MKMQKKLIKCASIALLLGGLAACQDAVELAANPASTTKAPKIPVAFVSVDGVPEARHALLNGALQKEAGLRDIIIVPAESQPRYQLRAYVSAHSNEAGQTELTYVFDVFDTRFKRAQRIHAREMVTGSAADGWSVVPQEAITRGAATSMEGVSKFLSQNASAVAGTPQGATGANKDAMKEPTMPAARPASLEGIAPITSSAISPQRLGLMR